MRKNISARCFILLFALILFLSAHLCSLHAAVVENSFLKKGLFSVDTSGFPKIDLFGFFNIQDINVTENNIDCSPLSPLKTKSNTVTLGICLGKKDTLDIPFEDAQNLAFFTFSKLSSISGFTVYSISRDAQVHLGKPSMDSGLIRSSVFQAQGAEEEFFVDGLIDVVSKFEKIKGPKVLLYFGAARLSHQSGGGLSSNSIESLKKLLKEKKIPLAIFSTVPDIIDGKIAELIKETNGILFGNTDTDDIAVFEKEIIALNNSLKGFQYTSPVVSQDGNIRNIEVRTKDKAYNFDYYTEVHKSSTKKLIITVKDDKHNPRSCKYSIKKEDKLISKGKIADDGILILNNLVPGAYVVSATDGHNSMNRRIILKETQENHVNFVFAYKKLLITSLDQYEKPVNVSYEIKKTLDREIVFRGNTGKNGFANLELLPEKYVLSVKWNDISENREFTIIETKDHIENFLFTRKNFTLAAIDLYNKPVKAKYSITGSNNFTSTGTLGDDGKTTLNIPPGRYIARLSYLNHENVKHFDVTKGRISGCTSKFPLFPVSLESFGQNDEAVDSSVKVIDTSSLAVIFTGTTGKKGKKLIHLYKGSYKFIFIKGNTRVDVFDRIKDKKNYHIRADFSMALLKLFLTREDDKPIQGWYQITDSAGKKVSSGAIHKGGTEVRLKIGKYDVLFRRTILDDTNDITKTLDLSLKGASLTAHLESVLSLEYLSTPAQDLQKCWYRIDVLDPHGRLQDSLEGRIFKDKRELRLFPGKYKVIIKTSPYSKVNVSKKFTLKPEKDYSLTADFTCNILIESEILDSTENPVYRLFDKSGKKELQRGEIDNGSHKIIVPPGKYLVKILPFYSSSDIFSKEIDVKSNKTVNLKKDFKIKE
jgi:hypothetical protein